MLFIQNINNKEMISGCRRENRCLALGIKHIVNNNPAHERDRITCNAKGCTYATECLLNSSLREQHNQLLSELGEANQQFTAGLLMLLFDKSSTRLS